MNFPTDIKEYLEYTSYSERSRVSQKLLRQLSLVLLFGGCSEGLCSAKKGATKCTRRSLQLPKWSAEKIWWSLEARMSQVLLGVKGFSLGRCSSAGAYLLISHFLYLGWLNECSVDQEHEASVQGGLEPLSILDSRVFKAPQPSYSHPTL